MVCSGVRPLASTSVTSARALKMLSRIKLRPLKSSHSPAQRVRSAMKCKGALRPNCFLSKAKKSEEATLFGRLSEEIKRNSRLFKAQLHVAELGLRGQLALHGGHVPAHQGVEEAQLRLTLRAFLRAFESS